MSVAVVSSPPGVGVWVVWLAALNLAGVGWWSGRRRPPGSAASLGGESVDRLERLDAEGRVVRRVRQLGHVVPTAARDPRGIGAHERVALGTFELDHADVLPTTLDAQLRLTGGTDPRTVGSGRTGGTNMLRAGGWPRAITVAVLDLAKGAVPILIARAADAAQGGDDDIVDAEFEEVKDEDNK